MGRHYTRAHESLAAKANLKIGHYKEWRDCHRGTEEAGKRRAGVGLEMQKRMLTCAEDKLHSVVPSPLRGFKRADSDVGPYNCPVFLRTGRRPSGCCAIAREVDFCLCGNIYIFHSPQA